MIMTLLLAALLGVAWLAGVVLPALIALPTRLLSRKLANPTTTLGRLSAGLFGANAVASPIILGAGLVLILGIWGFFAILEDVVMGDPIVALDDQIYRALQTLRTPAFDQLMIAITALGDQWVVAPVTLAAIALCAYYKRTIAETYLLVALAGGALIVGGIKMLIHRPRPAPIYNGPAEFSFPSGHAAVSIVVLGFLAVLLLQGAPQRWRRAIAFVLSAAVLLISFSRIYLGAHWFSDVAGGLLFGAAWVALLAILYLRSAEAPVPAAPLIAITLLAYLGAGAWHISRDFTRETGRYAIPATATSGSAKKP